MLRLSLLGVLSAIRLGQRFFGANHPLIKLGFHSIVFLYLQTIPFICSPRYLLKLHILHPEAGIFVEKNLR